MASQAKVQVNCPKCGADPLVTGFSVRTVVWDVWMRIGDEQRRVARTSKVSDAAVCLCCGEKLPATVKELKAA